MKNQKGVSLITLIITIIVVIILAVIVLRSGASDAPDQAAFSGFTQEMGELQDNVRVAMLTAKGEEQLKGNARSEAQLYNFVARGGSDVVADDAWLIQADAEAIPCTIINKDKAPVVLGAALPERKVETALGTNQEVSYFVTPEGTVFCWPPYVYDGKSYVNSNVEHAIPSGDVEATTATEVILDFGNGEKVKISKSSPEEATTAFTQGEGRDTFATDRTAEPSVWYGTDGRNASAPKTVGGVAQGFTFVGANPYVNTNVTTPSTPDDDGE